MNTSGFKPKTFRPESQTPEPLDYITPPPYRLSGARVQVQLHGLPLSVRLVRVLNSRLLGSDRSLLPSRCSDLTAVTPVKAPSEN